MVTIRKTRATSLKGRYAKKTDGRASIRRQRNHTGRYQGDIEKYENAIWSFNDAIEKLDMKRFKIESKIRDIGNKYDKLKTKDAQRNAILDMDMLKNQLYKVRNELSKYISARAEYELKLAEAYKKAENYDKLTGKDIVTFHAGKNTVHAVRRHREANIKRGKDFDFW